MEDTPRLYRSEHNRIIAGVCGGLGVYFKIDPVILRAIFVLVTLLGGSSVLVYLVLWLIIPSQSRVEVLPEELLRENAAELKDKAKAAGAELQEVIGKQRPSFWWGLTLLFLGVFFLLSNLGWVEPYHLLKIWRLWPIVLIGFGIASLVGK